MLDQNHNEGASARTPLPLFWDESKAQKLCALARVAGRIIMEIRERGFMATECKTDGSPVTHADHEAQALIVAGLKALTPEIPVIAEEQIKKISPLSAPACWLVDPLDGTRDYISGGNEFSVNIGLLVEGQPVLGLIYAPAQDDLFYGDAQTAFREKDGHHEKLADLMKEVQPPGKPRLITSRREAKRLPIPCWIDEGHIAEWRICSSAYKLGLLAAGEVDLFIRTGLTFEWDTAAGDAIIRAVGGRIITPGGAPLAYGKPEMKNGAFLSFRPDFDESTLPLFYGLIEGA